MRTLLVLLVSVFVFACGGESSSSSTDGDRGSACRDGSIVVPGPLVAIRARYPKASPPDMLLAHSMVPGMIVSVESGGWTRFSTYSFAPVLEGDEATLTTHDVATGEPLCPSEFVVE